MPGIACASCQQSVPLPLDGRLPPWCPKCGGEFRGTRLTAEERPAELLGPYAELERRAPKGTPRPRLAAEASEGPGWRPEGEAAAGVDRPAGRSGSFNFGLMLLAAGLLLVCAYLTLRGLEKVSDHKVVQGHVSGHTYTRKGFRMCQVSYVYNGRTYQTTGQSGSHEIGATLPVMVPPDDPGNGTVRSFSDLWLGPLITGALGAACLAFFRFDLRGN